MISDVPVNSLDGYTGYSRCRVQIDCYAATYGAAEELCQRVKMSVNNASGAPLIDTATATFDRDTGLHRVSLDVLSAARLPCMTKPNLIESQKPASNCKPAPALPSGPRSSS